ncbi:hypothetical protein NO976_03012 [Planktothrix agardhii]|jgi:hypothetical protein|uniref:Uncharacterized protein n=1 Tax=Planktothrix agardhii (strain NIVA-CYA 126/8) TaxID=388467 RepID=A0A073CG97_PLAA1|nr:hypothetical protein [Planktothrix agardhii]MEA5559971.1 hypothetical protein [Planktothrix agardhii UHCC 0887]KEI67299.1 hypothetical protein A19Y_2375 [Planktothrix agardhii NIVA-CYA 126/8]MCB8759887.1 hypothetical protein [Planktothrix agardhii 1813]MCB8764357.1 hypothetical protein [Planktothrix agardhii 1809]MCB8778009.1 hypothetical protein [Planktothrix agardhii 1031]
MAKKQPNPLQKMVRGFLRDMINQTNDQKPDKSSKPKRKKLVVENLELDPKSNAGTYRGFLGIKTLTNILILF